MTQTKIYLKDYLPPVYHVNSVDLDICLFDDHAIVSSTLQMHKKHTGDLILFGQELELLELSVNGNHLSENDYILNQETLTIKNASPLKPTPL